MGFAITTISSGISNYFANSAKNGTSVIRRLVQWFATALLFGAGFYMATNPIAGIQWPVFSVFLIGHIIWVIDSVIAKHPPMIGLNVSLVLLDSYAIYVRLFN